MSDLMLSARKFQELYGNAVAALQSSARAKQATLAALKRAGREHAYLREWKDGLDAAREVFKEFAAQLFDHADRAMRSAGTPITIDRAVLEEQWADRPRPHRWGNDEAESVELAFAATRSLITVAESIARQCDPKRAQRLALIEAAQRLRAMFQRPDWDKSPAVTEKSGRMVMSTYVYWEAWQAWALSYDTMNSIVSALNALDAIARHAGLGSLLAAQAASVLQREIRNGSYRSRQRVTLGSGLSLQFFKGQCHWEFDPHLLEAVQVAIAEHADAGLMAD